MKQIIFLILFSTAISATSFAQTQDDTTRFVTDKMFELAWENYPQNRIKEQQSAVAAYDIKLAKWSWTKDLSAQFNLNEANINPNATQGVNIFYPKYVFGLRLNLGTFVLTPLETKKARQEYAITKSEIDLQRVMIRNEVAKRVYAYKLAKYVLKIRTQAVEESGTSQNIIKQKFQKNEIAFEQYNTAALSHLSLLESRFEAETNYYTTKNDLETLIGVRLETLKLPPSF
ncbi:MAG: TolC family protein [Opitutaceae bacterium]|nr:TolC family protein [Cytophagales bacterium]